MTPKPWKIIDTIGDRGQGYLAIRGPNGEKVADMFPFAGENGVGLDAARENARLIVSLVNGDPVI